MYHSIIIGILMISSVAHSQKGNVEEERDLVFQTHFFEALKQTAIKNYAKAIESLEKSHGIDSVNLAVHFEFSKNYLLLNKYYEATIFVDKGLEMDPDNMHLLKHKVAISKGQRDLKKAIEIQKKIVLLWPKYADELVLLYIQNKDFELAEKLIGEIQLNGLTSSRIKAFKSYLENRKKPNQGVVLNSNKSTGTESIDGLKKSFTEGKKFDVLKKLLDLEHLENKFEMLQLDSKEGLDLFPTQPYLYLMNALSLNKLRKYNEAIVVLSIGIDFVIDNEELEATFYDEYSISYKGLKNESEALKYQQKAENLRNKN